MQIPVNISIEGTEIYSQSSDEQMRREENQYAASYRRGALLAATGALLMLTDR